jgi:hypothetical protein
MSLRCVKRLPCWAVLSGAAWLALAASPSSAQFGLFRKWKEDCPPACVPSGPAPQHYYQQPVHPPALPGQVITPQQPQVTPQQPQVPQTPQQPQVAPEQPQLPGEQAAAAGGETFAAAFGNTGYIDSAIPRSQFRLRYDAAYDNNRPDRAEVFYAQCGCLVPPGENPNKFGPPRPEVRVDFQEIHALAEYAFNRRVSAFFELPIRLINPVVNDNASGLGDVSAGIKLALIADPCQFLTFQLRVIAPSGQSDRGLGNNHTTIEPAILAYRRLSDRLVLEAELRDWIPAGGTNYAGNVLRYGIGLGYDVVNDDDLRITPVAELVGWTVLSGRYSTLEAMPTRDASGDTIVNAKLGVRASLNQCNSLYVGYGRALTGEVWYKDIIRVEYRLAY